MKLMDYINRFDKLCVYEFYCRVIVNFKDYDNISKSKMIEEIISFYSKSENIIAVCTEKELRYLEKKMTGELVETGYSLVRKQLMNKFLLISDGEVVVPEELLGSIRQAILVVDWELVTVRDQLGSLLTGICKVYGEISVDVLIEAAIELGNFSREELVDFIERDKLFYYYVLVGERDFFGGTNVVRVAIYRDYEDYRSNLDVLRYGQEVSWNGMVSIEDVVNIFYYDFNINRENVKRFYDYYLEVTAGKLLFSRDVVISSLLNSDRGVLREQLGRVLFLSLEEEEKFLRLMELAMDEMPSGGLNGMTPKEASKFGVVENR